MCLLTLLGMSLDTDGRKMFSDWERERDKKEDGLTKQWLEEMIQTWAYFERDSHEIRANIWKHQS